MTRNARRWLALGVAVAAGVATALALPGGSRAAPLAQDKGNPAAAKVGDPHCAALGKGPTEQTGGKPAGSIIGCALCHSGAALPEVLKELKADEFVLLNESAIWLSADIHSRAFTMLGGPVAERMREVLGLGNKSYKVVEDVRCLTCHATDLSPAKPLAAKVLTDFEPRATGINCAVCHGLPGNWQGTEHYQGNWRAKSPAEKWERGMTDLRNPVVKARLCVSCHVGSVAEGRIVTHEMYAAGHPPLPPFELSSYMEGEPKHWAYPTDRRLKYFATVPEKDRWRLYRFHAADKESYLSRHYAVGAVAALRAEAELLLAEAETASKSGDLIDYARFDCYSCHHAVPNPERQQRPLDGPPGRPPLRAAAGLPASVVAKHAEAIDAGDMKAKATGFDERWAALRKAAVARPFGHPAMVMESARSMIDWCDAFLTAQCDAEVPLYSTDQAKRLRGMIADAAVGPAAADPEAALSLAWAHQTLSTEAGVKLATDKLSNVMPLNVRVAPYTDKANKPVPAQYLPRMDAINKFDPLAFRNAFGTPK